jgi:hypothetical protein
MILKMRIMMRLDDAIYSLLLHLTMITLVMIVVISKMRRMRMRMMLIPMGMGHQLMMTTILGSMIGGLL